MGRGRAGESGENGFREELGYGLHIPVDSRLTGLWNGGESWFIEGEARKNSVQWTVDSECEIWAQKSPTKNQNLSLTLHLSSLHSISGKMTGALCVYSAVFMRYA